MDIIITIQHPAHVHFFKNSIKSLKSNGENVYVYTRKRGITSALLNSYGINYELLTKTRHGPVGLLRTQIMYESKLLYKSIRVDPDVMMAIGEPGVAHVSSLVGAQGILFVDTEHVRRKNTVYRFADKICTPNCFKTDLGPNQEKYNGFHELAYLHPNYYEPNKDVLENIGLSEKDNFVVMRLVSWDALHDIGNSGIKNPIKFIEEIEATGYKVLLTAEGHITENLKPYQVDISPNRIHDLMYYSDLFIGEGATMASESAMLGTPAIFISTVKLGYLDYLSNEYGMVYNYNDKERYNNALEMAIKILDNYNQKKWHDRHKKLLESKIDVTNYITDKVYKISKVNR